MTAQTEAERLADTLDIEIFVTMEDLKQAAAKLRRLELANTELQSEILEQCRINGMGAEREDALRAEVVRLKQSAQQAQPAPVQERKPLTLDQIGSIIEACEKNVKGEFLVEFARAIESKVKENK